MRLLRSDGPFSAEKRNLHYACSVNRKKRIRDAVILLRNTFSGIRKQEADTRIESAILTLPIVRNAKVICIYVSSPEEVNTTGMMQSFLSRGQAVAVPKICGQKDLRLYRIASFGDLTPGSYSIREPLDSCVIVDPVAVDVFIVPGVAFDRTGHRLGRGQGYYDRLLSGLRNPKVAPAYDFQVLAQVPHSSYDVPMTEIVTQKETIII